jgi:hypothetical protein
LHLNLGHFVGFFSLMLPLWWDNYRTTSEAPSPGFEAEGRTPKLLRLKFHCIFLFYLFSFIYFFILYFNFFIYMYMYTFFLSFTYFLFLFLYLFFLFFILNPLSATLMPFQLTVN